MRQEFLDLHSPVNAVTLLRWEKEKLWILQTSAVVATVIAGVSLFFRLSILEILKIERMEMVEKLTGLSSVIGCRLLLHADASWKQIKESEFRRKCEETSEEISRYTRSDYIK